LISVRQAVLGEIVLGVLLAGTFGGMAMVYAYRHGVFITGIHGEVALVMVPLMIFGLVSGVYMNRKKRQRRILPLVHGLNNLAVLVMAGSQIVSGSGIYRAFVLGG
jgi:nitric oxide reductase large subunit